MTFPAQAPISQHPTLPALCLALACLLPAGQLNAGPPLEPGSGEVEWVQLVSGEWLQGELKRMRNDTLEFDSEKLDLLKLDWSDVNSLRTRRSMMVSLDDGTELEGPLTLEGGQLTVAGRRFERARLLAIIPGSKDARGSYWSGKAGLGMTLSSGNTDQTNFNILARLDREVVDSRMGVEYAGNFGRLDGETNTDNHRVAGGYKLFVSRRLFLQIPTVELFRDRFQNIGLRTGIVAGAGYTLVDSPDTDWSVTAAAGYRRTDYDSVAAGQPDSDDTANLWLGTRFDQDLAWDTDLTLEYGLQLAVPDTADNIQRFSAILSTEILGPVDLDLAFVWDRVNQPVPRADGSVPKPDDFRTTVGLGVDF